MVREILKIYTDNGLGDNNPTFHDIELTEYQYKSSRMGMPELTATLMWESCLDDEWTNTEYVVLNGARFYIRHTPSSSKDNTDARYKHEISFTSEVAEILGNTYFVDAVPSYAETYDKPCTNNSKFTFFGTISEFCDRLNCAFIYAGIADSVLKTKTSLTPLDTPVGDGYCVMLDPYGEGDIYDPDKSYEFSFEDKYLWEAITYGYETTEVPFERRGRKIIFGAVPQVVEHKFEYGHDNELLSVSKKNSNAKVVNRITMMGSSENIPHYYPNETEYGHIDLAASENNSVLTTDMLSIANMTQLLSRLNADSTAVLGKYDGIDVGNAKIEITKYTTAFFDNVFADYQLGEQLRYDKTNERVTRVQLHIQTHFKVTESGVVDCKNVRGNVWIQNNTPTEDETGIIENVRPEMLSSESRGDMSYQLTQDESGMSLGVLSPGKYIFQFCITINIGSANTAFCKLASVGLGAAKKQKTGYYWDVDGKKYDGVGALGVKISQTVTDAMIGDGFKWVASGRMPFQTNLIPPKYRETLGAERFYNAINNTYTDPDTNAPYVFPNPYVEGAPSEHIFRDDNRKPTIEGVTNASGQLMGVIADIAYDADDNDVLKTDSEVADKNDSLKYEHSFFYIKLNIFNGTYGFDLFAHASQTDAMTIQMREGSCNGCKFKIQALEYEDENGLKSFKNPVQTTGENGDIVHGGYSDKVKDSWQEWQQNTQTHSIWICVQKDAETFGVLMPNQSNNFKPAIGDKFNIINIDMPLTYWYAAEKRLEEDGIRDMADNNEEKFTFDINASRIYFAEHPEVLAQIDEYSIIKVKYNGKTYEQYVNQLTIDCKDNEALPNIGIDLTDTLAVGQSFVEQVAERASSLIANPYTMGGALGGGGGLTTRLADRRYLKKTEADRSQGKVASDIGFEVGEFVSGGSGGIFYQDPETGQTYIEADKLKIRMKAIFEELEIAKVSTIGGKFIITPGGGLTISFVERILDGGGVVTGYRCYFKGKDEDKGAKCRFVVGDQVQCHEFNIQNGTTKAASNRYYWRLVTAVNNDESYIELSNTDCDNAYEIPSDIPQAGDTIVQLGNRNDNQRQSAIVLSTVDTFAPCVTLYNGIDHYSLAGKAVVEYGVDKTKNTPEPFFNCYGRFFYGPKGGNSYLKFEPSFGKLIFSGELINISTLNGKDIDQYIKDVVPPVTQEDIEGYVNAIVDPQIEGIQNQIDGVIETWFYNGVPTLSNYPASDWNTNNLKIQHLGDLYYDNDTGTAYRFSQDAQGDYYWNVITDDAITKALAAAQKAQDTADGKRKTFVDTPTPPYQKGDLWVNATYPSNTTQATRDPNNNKYYLDILRCKTDKETGTFAISDWTLASNYTDDTLANQAITEIAGYQYIRQALANGATTTTGGLILTSLIKLGEWDLTNPESPIQTAVYAGMNGQYNHDKTIVSWWGGDMVDKYYNDSVTPRPTPLTTGYAKALVRMDGSAYFAGGNIGFNADGSGWLGGEDNIKFSADGSMTFGSGIKINLNTGEAGLKSTIESFANLLAYFIPEDSNGNSVDWSDGSNVIDRIRVTKGFYSDSFLSAFGLSSSGSGGGTGGVSELRYLSDVLLSNPQNGQSLVYNGTKWVNQRVGLDESSLATYLTTNNYAKKSDIPSLTGYATEQWVTNKGYITNAALSGYATETWVEGKGYLTDYTIHALTLQSGTFTAKTYNPKTGAATVNIPTTTSHISEGTRLYFTDARAQSALSSTVTNINNAINLKLDTATFNAFKALFDEYFTLENVNGVKRIKANYGLYSTDFVSSFGISADSGSGSGVNYNRLDAWSDYDSDKASWVLSAALGYSLYQNKASAADLTALTTRVASLEDGSALHTLTIQKNGTTVGTFKPNAAATINISDVASAATLSSHTGNSTIHITAAERTKWNTTSSNLDTILGSDADGTLNKWNEIVDFLATYTEADTLANLLSNKVDKESGKGLSTNDFTDALLSKLNGIESGANKYIHPTNGANTTISAANGKVLSAITVNSLGHVTSVSSKSLVEADIPTLSISKISGLQTALDAKLEKSVFEDMFEKVNIGTTASPVWAIKAKFGLYTNSFLSAFGLNSVGSSSGGGGLIQNVYGWNDLGGTFSDTLTDTFNAFTINKIYNDKLSKTEAQSLYQPKGNYLTEHQSLANYVTLNTAQTISGAKTFTDNVVMGAEKCFIGYQPRKKEGDGGWAYHPFSVKDISGSDFAHLGVYGSSNTLGYIYIGSGKYDSQTNLRISPNGVVSAAMFIKYGGTSSQFLKADGSVDSTSYLAASSYTASDVLSKLLTVDGASSGLDADMLDGKHLSDILASNVASATKLKDAHTFWGSSFDGQGDVAGDMTGVGNVNMYGRLNIISGTTYDVGDLTGIIMCGLRDDTGKRYAGIFAVSEAIYSNATGLAFYTGVNDIGSTEKVRIDAYGRVGIGTPSPQYDLDVNGTMRATALRLGASPAIEWDAANNAFKINANVYATGEITALGVGSAGGGGGGGSAYGLLTDWAHYADKTPQDALGANLGYGLKNSLSALTTRVASLESGSALTLTTTGSGNAITSISKSGTTITATKGATFLTSHQSLADYLKTDGSNGTQAGVSAIVQKLPEASGDVTDDTLIVTSHIEPSDSNNLFYRRPALRMWNYVKSKTDSLYLSLTGGTLRGQLIINVDGNARTAYINSTNANFTTLLFRNENTLLGGLAAKKDDHDSLYRIKNDFAGIFKIWDSGNDGAGSGLDADLLDGKHANYFVDYNTNLNGNNVDFNSVSYNRMTALTIQPIHTTNYTGITNDPTNTYGQMVTFGSLGGYFPFRIAFAYTNRLYVQGAGYKTSEQFDFSNGTVWKTIAFTTDNVASATRLQTNATFKAWGQTFFSAGVPQSVSGDMTGVGNLTMTGKLTVPYVGGLWATAVDNITIQTASPQLAGNAYGLVRFNTASGDMAMLGGEGNSVGLFGWSEMSVSAGFGSPEWRTHWNVGTGELIHTANMGVYGTFYASGALTAYSTLSVAGALTAATSVSVGNNLTVGGVAQFNNILRIGGDDGVTIQCVTINGEKALKIGGHIISTQNVTAFQ